ncbi:hypothetical protein GALL_358390 [mine drainage metagenome]|uniref:Uncharacterized protein n=1 Tax=mine drainage metagenome TaxID=410659 RepID=A0A1J5QGL7_9ZZZZ
MTPRPDPSGSLGGREATVAGGVIVRGVSRDAAIADEGMVLDDRLDDDVVGS